MGQVNVLPYPMVEIMNAKTNFKKQCKICAEVLNASFSKTIKWLLDQCNKLWITNTTIDLEMWPYCKNTKNGNLYEKVQSHVWLKSHCGG